MTKSDVDLDMRHKSLRPETEASGCGEAYSQVSGVNNVRFCLSLEGRDKNNRVIQAFAQFNGICFIQSLLGRRQDSIYGTVTKNKIDQSEEASNWTTPCDESGQTVVVGLHIYTLT